jgi:hypothetical protein
MADEDIHAEIDVDETWIDNDASVVDADPPIPPAPVETESETEDVRPKRRRVEIEDVIDEDDEESRWIEDFPTAAGATKGRCESTFQTHRNAQQTAGNAPWAPFESKKEWELARWLMTSGISQKKMDSFLKLESVRTFGTSKVTALMFVRSKEM